MNTFDAAKYWVSKGVPVFPLKPHSKEPAIANGFHSASLKEGDLQRWFQSTNNNIGARTGSGANFFVIDIDIKNGKDGRDSLYKKFGKRFLLPKGALLFRTPTGGLHIPVRYPQEYEVPSKVNVIGLDGVDIRGNGGYIVVAPSSLIIDEEEKYYRVNDLSLPIAEPVGWIAELLEELNSSGTKAKFDPTNAMRGVDGGQRNSVLFAYARHLCAHGIDNGLLLGFVMEAASRCKPPLCESEAAQIIENAFSYGSRQNKKSKQKKSLEDYI